MARFTHVLHFLMVCFFFGWLVYRLRNKFCSCCWIWYDWFFRIFDKSYTCSIKIYRYALARECTNADIHIHSKWKNSREYSSSSRWNEKERGDWENSPKNTSQRFFQHSLNLVNRCRSPFFFFLLPRNYTLLRVRSSLSSFLLFLLYL